MLAALTPGPKDLTVEALVGREPHWWSEALAEVAWLPVQYSAWDCEQQSLDVLAAIPLAIGEEVLQCRKVEGCV